MLLLCRISSSDKGQTFGQARTRYSSFHQKNKYKKQPSPQKQQTNKNKNKTNNKNKQQQKQTNKQNKKQQQQKTTNKQTKNKKNNKKTKQNKNRINRMYVFVYFTKRDTETKWIIKLGGDACMVFVSLLFLFFYNREYNRPYQNANNQT